MKRWPIVALLCAVTLAVAPVALAAGHQGKGNTKTQTKSHGKSHVAHVSKFQCEATLVSATAPTDATLGSIVVTVKCGSKAVKACRTQQVTMQIAAGARLVNGIDDTAPLTLDTLVAGSKLHLGGTVQPGQPAVFTVGKLILQKVPAPAPSAAPSPTDPPTPTPTDSPAPTDSPTPVASTVPAT